MTEQQLEATRKLKEGIVAILKEKITLHSIRSGQGVFNITSYEDIADSLLHNLPIPLYLDTGELTDWEASQYALNGFVLSNPRSPVPEWLYSDICEVIVKEVVKAAHARFKSIGE